MAETRAVSDKETIVKIIIAIHYKIFPGTKFISPRDTLNKMQLEIEKLRIYEQVTERRAIQEESND